MRRLALIVVVLALPAGLSGQRLPLQIGVGAGVVAPAGSFGDVDQMGWHLTATGLVGVKGSLHLVLAALYGQTAHKNGVGGKTTLDGGGADFALFVARERRVRPFVALGAGLYRVDVEVPGFGGAVATKPAFDVGGGVLVASGARRVLVALRYVSVHTTPQRTSFMPLSVGLLLPVGRH
jgi:hypothetical protein